MDWKGDFYDLGMGREPGQQYIDPPLGGPDEPIHEGGAAAGVDPKIHEGGDAAVVDPKNSESNSNAPGVMNTSLNVPTAPPVPLASQNQFSVDSLYVRATPSDGKIPEKIIKSASSTVAIASDCGAPRIHIEQQRPRCC